MSNKCDGNAIDCQIAAASSALSVGDPLAALKHVSLRTDAPALALRGIAMAQLGDIIRAKELLAKAARLFGNQRPLARARCNLAEAEIALMFRDLGRTMKQLRNNKAILKRFGDRANAAHAGYLEARGLLLIGRLDEAEQALRDLDASELPMTSRVGYELVTAGIAMRRICAASARQALDRARITAVRAGPAALRVEVDRAEQAFEAPIARRVARNLEQLLRLDEVEALIASNALIIDACRNMVSVDNANLLLGSRPVLFALLRMLGEAWPDDCTREELLARVFRAREADESHRARLRVEIGRLREAIGSRLAIHATKRGFRLEANQVTRVVVLAPPIDERHGDFLALLADGEAWSSSALALALGVSTRTVQRALDRLAEEGKVEWFGQGRARRWIANRVPGFPTSLLLPAIGVVG